MLGPDRPARRCAVPAASVSNKGARRWFVQFSWLWQAASCCYSPPFINDAFARGGRGGYGYRGYGYSYGAAAVGAAAAGSYYRGGCGYGPYGNWVCPNYGYAPY